MALHVIAQFVVRPDEIQAAGDILRELVGPIRSDPGCLRCNLVVDKENPASFAYIEEWRDEAALDQHLKDAEVLRLVDLVVPLLATPFSLARYNDAAR
jgi:quinol monooxygenase YgiN